MDGGRIAEAEILMSVEAGERAGTRVAGSACHSRRDGEERAAQRGCLG